MLFWEGATFTEVDYKDAKRHNGKGFAVWLSKEGENFLYPVIFLYELAQYEGYQFFKLQNWGTYK